MDFELCEALNGLDYNNRLPVVFQSTCAFLFLLSLALFPLSPLLHYFSLFPSLPPSLYLIYLLILLTPYLPATCTICIYIFIYT